MSWNDLMISWQECETDCLHLKNHFRRWLFLDLFLIFFYFFHFHAFAWHHLPQLEFSPSTNLALDFTHKSKMLDICLLASENRLKNVPEHLIIWCNQHLNTSRLKFNQFLSDEKKKNKTFSDPIFSWTLKTFIGPKKFWENNSRNQTPVEYRTFYKHLETNTSINQCEKTIKYVSVSNKPTVPHKSWKIYSGSQ